MSRFNESSNMGNSMGNSGFSNAPVSEGSNAPGINAPSQGGNRGAQ